MNRIRKSILIALMLLVMACLFAFDYSLEFMSFKPIYDEYDADRNRATLDFQYAYVYDGYPTYIYQNDVKFNFNDPEKWRVQPFIGIYHLGETLSLFRNSFTFDSFLSPLRFDFEFHGSITNAMEGHMADTIGYDGVYFYGLAASVADVVSMRFGYSHHCTHYGDGTYKQLEPGKDVTDGFSEWFKYLRMDSAVFSLSIRPIESLRIFGEINFDLGTTYVIPEVFSPTWALYGAEADDVPSSYKNLIISYGVEFSHTFFENLGPTKFAYIGRAYEEGKIAYKEEDLAAAGRTKAFYDPNRPWEFENTFNIAQHINDLVSFEITWHTGRFVLNSYYATRSSYVTIGARLNFDGGTVMLYDSAKY